jgi:hypothetical protein
MTSRAEKPWPSGISDEEQAIVVPYLALIPLDAGRFAKAGNLHYSAFHDDSSLPVIFSSSSISLL